MAIYPVTFVLYLGRIAPDWTAGHRGTLWALLVVVGCAAWNLRGAKAVGGGSVWLFGVMLLPFAVLIGVGLWHGFAEHAVGGGWGALTRPVAGRDLGAALSVCLWNYMGWDNASTVAQEVEEPQRNVSARDAGGSGDWWRWRICCRWRRCGCGRGCSAERFSTGAWSGCGAAARRGQAARRGAGAGGASWRGTLDSGVALYNALVLALDAAAVCAGASMRLMPRVFLRRLTANGTCRGRVCCLCAVAMGAWLLQLYV